RDLALSQRLAHTFFGELWIGEVLLEVRTYQRVAPDPGQSLHLLIHVGDDAHRVGGDQRVDVGLDQRARVHLRVAQLLLQLLLGADLASPGEDAEGVAARVGEHYGVEAHRDPPALAG